MNQKASRKIIYFISLLGFLSLFSLAFLRFDFRIENLFPSHDADVEFYKNFKAQFQPEDEEIIFIGLHNNRGIFCEEFLKKTDTLAQYLSKLDHIHKVYSLTNSNVIFYRDSQVNARPLIHIHQPELYAGDSVYLFQSREYRDHLVSKDGRTIAVVAFHDPDLTGKQKTELLTGIQSEIEGLSFDASHLVSKMKAEKMLMAEAERNARNYILLLLMLVAVVLSVFRSFRSILPVLMIIILPVLIMTAVISLLHFPLHIIYGLLPVVAAITGIPAGFLFLSTYTDQLKKGFSKEDALRRTVLEIRPSLFVSPLAAVSIFLTLAVYDYIPVHLFGILAGLSVLISIGLSIFFLPAYYFLVPVPAIGNRNLPFGKWDAFLSGLFMRITRNRVNVLVCFSVLALGPVFFIKKIEINANMLHEIPKHSPLLEDYHFMEQDFSGTRPFEMVLSVNDTKHSFFDLALMKRVEDIERFLEDSCRVGHMISPLSLFKGANKAFNKGENSSFRLPASQQYINRFYEAIMQTEHADEMQRYMLADGRSVRISGSLPGITSKKFGLLKERFAEFFRSKSYTGYFDYRMTGQAFLFDKVTENIERNLLIGGVTAFLVVVLLSFYLLRSWLVGMIAFVVSSLPVLLAAALMGMLDIYLKADTATILVILFVIGTLNTLYFLCCFKAGLAKGKSASDAVKTAYLSIGKLLTGCACVLLAALLPLLVCNFAIINEAGLLIGTALVSSLILTLSLLPVLILMFYRRNEDPAAVARSLVFQGTARTVTEKDQSK
jgi:predicted RND superfamily exporter protein